MKPKDAEEWLILVMVAMGVFLLVGLLSIAFGGR